MIIGIFISFIGLILSAMYGILAGFNFALPSELFDASNYFISHLVFLSGFINFADIFSALGWFVLFELYWYTFKLVLKVFNILPWFHRFNKPNEH